MYRAVRIKILALMVLVWSQVSFAGTEFDATFRCYRGVGIAIGLTRSLEYASAIVLVSDRLRVGNDVFCSSALTGGCSLDEDGGHFDIIEIDDTKLIVDLKGEPKIVGGAEEGSAAWIVPYDGAPDRMKRVQLKRTDNLYCKY